MNKEVVRPRPAEPLFREAAVQAAGFRLFGGVSIVVPPSTTHSVIVSFLVLAALSGVVMIVEVPQRSKAVGVLMPSGGLTDVVASESGRVEDVVVAAGESVASGDLLLRVVGGDGSSQGQPLSLLALHSLQEESSLRKDAYRRKQQMATSRLKSLEERLDTAHARLRNGREQFRASQARLDVLERRTGRRQALMQSGHIAADSFDLDFSELLSGRAARAERESNVTGLAEDVRELERNISEMRNQLSLDEVDFRIASKRLQRELLTADHQASGDYRAAKAAVVAHLLAQPGMAVRAGQVLAKLRRPNDVLEAWLYVSTAQARSLQRGQPVELRLDAYPHQVFGTFTATVVSVSGVALLPRELTVPLIIPGPVFEVRARLDDADLTSSGLTSNIQAGTSFRADIVRQHLKLYEWLLRSFFGPTDEVANAGA